MEKSATLRDCLDEAGDFDLDKYVDYKKKRDELLEEVEDLEEVPPKKMPFRKRNSDGYFPNDCLESEWYRRYVQYPDHPLNKKHMNLFRRRFRMPHSAFKDLVKEARIDNWFPDYEKRNALGDMGVSLDILILELYVILEGAGLLMTSTKLQASLKKYIADSLKSLL